MAEYAPGSGSSQSMPQKPTPGEPPDGEPDGGEGNEGLPGAGKVLDRRRAKSCSPPTFR